MEILKDDIGGDGDMSFDLDTEHKPVSNQSRLSPTYTWDELMSLLSTHRACDCEANGFSPLTRPADEPADVLKKVKISSRHSFARLTLIRDT